MYQSQFQLLLFPYSNSYYKDTIRILISKLKRDFLPNFNRKIPLSKVKQLSLENSKDLLKDDNSDLFLMFLPLVLELKFGIFIK